MLKKIHLLFSIFLLSYLIVGCSSSQKINYSNGIASNQEDKILQKLIPNFTKKVNCKVDIYNTNIIKLDSTETKSKFYVGAPTGCMIFSNVTPQNVDSVKNGFHFICEYVEKNRKTCCWPEGYYNEEFLTCAR